MEVFSCKTKIISGPGAIRELERLGIQRLLIVADPFFRDTGLPEKLKQAAIAREENPEYSLSELAALMEPPITKPAMNHRLQKLVAMAKEASQ